MDAVTLVAVADADVTSVSKVASKYKARAYRDYREMLARERLDMVSVAVPTFLHYQVAADVLGHGVATLVEKPLAFTVAQGEALVRLAEQKGVPLGVGHVERFNPVIREMKSRLEFGQLGRVFQISVRRVGPFPTRVGDVGIFFDLATHDIDLLHYLTGSEVQRSSAECAQMLHTSHEDLGVALLRFGNGIIGVLIENWLSPVKVREVTVNGERGMFVADLLTQDLYFYENDHGVGGWESLQMFRGVAEGKMVRYRLVRNEPLRLELEAFARTVYEGQPFLVSGIEGLRAMRVAEGLLQSASAGVGLPRGSSIAAEQATAYAG
jgi:predicted dehydrogenase